MTDELVNIGTLVLRLKHLGISRRWIEREAKAGRLPHTLVGNRRVYSLAAVEAALLERARQLPTQPKGG